MRASERSRRRQLLLGKALRGIAERLFLWHDQPRVERALRDGRALGRARINAAGAAESRYDSSAQVTGARTSGIVEMLVKCWAPRHWWTYQRRYVNAGPKGFDSRAGTSAG